VWIFGVVVVRTVFGKYAGRFQRLLECHARLLREYPNVDVGYFPELGKMDIPRDEVSTALVVESAGMAKAESECHV
jgi:hypothetical protein